MADDHAFLLPVVIDDTGQTGARVPEKFLSIQWVRAPGGQPNAALQSLCKRLVAGEPVAGAQAPAPASGAARRARVAARPPVVYPPFPTEDPAAKAQFWLHVVGWAFQSAWIFFKQLPRWIRVLISVWLCVVLLSKGCSSNDHRSSRISPRDTDQLNAISEKYHGSFDKKDISQLAAQIARITSDAETPAERSPLLALPFTAPAGNAEAAKLADSTFALVYGKLAIAHRGRVGLSQESVQCDDAKAALERGRSNHSAYVLCGAIGTEAAAQVLSVKIFKVSDGSMAWSKSYPVAGADPAKIAAEVNSGVPDLDDES